MGISKSPDEVEDQTKLPFVHKVQAVVDVLFQPFLCHYSSLHISWFFTFCLQIRTNVRRLQGVLRNFGIKYDLLSPTEGQEILFSGMDHSSFENIAAIARVLGGSLDDLECCQIPGGEVISTVYIRPIHPLTEGVYTATIILFE